MKSIAQYLHKTGSLGRVKKARLSPVFHENVSKIVKVMSQDIVKKHIKVIATCRNEQ